MFLKNFLKISDILLDFRRQKLVSLESVAKAKCLVGLGGCGVRNCSLKVVKYRQIIE
jgi:hypothetical protein